MPATENRRRTTRRAIPAEELIKDDERAAVGAVLGGVRHSSSRKHHQPRKRKLRRWGRHELSDISLMLLCLGVFMVIYTVRYKSSQTINHPSLAGVSKEFRQAYQHSRQKVSSHTELYDEVYKLATERLKPPDETIWPEYERRPYQLKSTYGPSVDHCSLSIAVLETRLGKPVYDFGPGQPLWFELESIAAFAPGACVVLQTTTCSMNEYLGKDATEKEMQKEIVTNIYDSSLPLFRRLIESGRVRITFMDHREYNLPTCRDFQTPSAVYLNRNYWDREFLDGVDSDTVMIFQEGVSLCYPLENVEALSSNALVGALWPRDSSPSWIPEPLEGACRGMGVRWKNWLRPQRRWKMQQDNPALAAKQHHPAPKPRELLSEEYPEICSNGRGPVGHGDFSLRNRQWMIRAIETCPHVTLSGLKVEDEPFACKVFETVSDDFYFGTVLAGIGAPLPNAFEASLFASQMLLPEQAWKTYGFPITTTDSGNGEHHQSSSSWESSRRPTIRIPLEDSSGGKVDNENNADDETTTTMTIPYALIKPWLYHSNEFLRSEVMSNACPFLPYSLTPEILSEEKMAISNGGDEESSSFETDHWVGIGH